MASEPSCDACSPYEISTLRRERNPRTDQLATLLLYTLGSVVGERSDVSHRLEVVPATSTERQDGPKDNEHLVVAPAAGGLLSLVGISASSSELAACRTG